jgi:SAM-dependent methyltransferase
VARDDFYASPLGVAYSAYMERQWLSRPLGRLFWGGDSRTYYESMGAIREVAPGGTVVDCPCGAGPAFRELRPGGDIRYIAADLSPSMLRRARRRATARALEIEFLAANATEIPLPSASADLFLSFWGLHCFDEPDAALLEAARVLKPGGRLVGSCFLRGTDSRRQRHFIRPGVGGFGREIGTQSEVEAWLAAAELDVVSLSRSGLMFFFGAHRA